MTDEPSATATELPTEEPHEGFGTASTTRLTFYAMLLWSCDYTSLFEAERSASAAQLIGEEGCMDAWVSRYAGAVLRRGGEKAAEMRRKIEMRLGDAADVLARTINMF